jgi:1-deoxy-D-xylulose-5-phosphate reductoisomerase
VTRRLTLLGATGSIGRQTLDVLARHPGDYEVFALSANRKWQELADLCLSARPRYAVLADDAAAIELRNHLHALGSDTEVLAGQAALAQVAAATEVDVVVAGIVGAAGVAPTLEAVKAGKTLLLANKEALVVTGSLFMDAVRKAGATLLPLDSEHSAIFQCLPSGFRCAAANEGLAGVEKLLLTASGGPFRECSREALEGVTVAQALNHPNWKMGPKITVDSATLMNKGLELIEACWLFGVQPEQIDVVVHPQSVVHSMVQYRDGAVLAQLGTPDMRCPIAVGLAWPERMESGASRLDFRQLANLTFEAPDETRFPCLALARAAMQAGGTATAVLNAANEEAVAAFLAERIGFMRIPQLVEAALEQVAAPACHSLDEVMQVDLAARLFVRQQLGGICP